MDKIKTYYSYNGRLDNEDTLLDKKIPKNAVYEVVKMVDAKPLFFQDHMNRFMNSLKNMGYTMNISNEQLIKEIIVLSRVNMNKNANIQMVYIPKETKGEYDFMLSFMDGLTLTEDEKENGIGVETLAIERQNPNVKTVGGSYKDRITSSATYPDTFELLLVNQEGYITEGSRSNVFFVKDKKIITSPAQNVLLGVTRKYILELCKKNEIQIEYKNIKEEEIYAVDGAFLTGTTVDVVPIRKVNNVEFQRLDSIVLLLRNEYNGLMKENLDQFGVK